METKVDDLFAELDRGSAAAEVVVSSSSKTESIVPPIDASSPAQVVPRGKKRELTVEQRRERTLQNLEAEIFQESMQIVLESFKFREIDAPLKDENGNAYFADPDPPRHWVEELEAKHPGHGLELAQQRLRCAQAGHMSKKDSPVAVQVAQAIAIGISRSRASLNAGPKTLNVQVVQMAAPLPDFPELRLTAGEK